jgi:uncharacterized protein YhfF
MVTDNNKAGRREVMSGKKEAACAALRSHNVERDVERGVETGELGYIPR